MSELLKGFAETVGCNGSEGAVGRRSLRYFSVSPSRNLSVVAPHAFDVVEPSLTQLIGGQQ
jgi:hypothetical protein